MMQALLWRYRGGSVLARETDIAGVPDEEVADDSKYSTNKDREEHESGYARVEVVSDGVDNWEGFKEKVYAAIDELGEV